MLSFKLSKEVEESCHSGYFYSAPSSPLLTQRRYRHSTDIVSEFQAEAPQATASEGLAKGPVVVARARFEPTTLRTKGDKSTNEPLWVLILSIRYDDGITLYSERSKFGKTTVDCHDSLSVVLMSVLLEYLWSLIFRPLVQRSGTTVSLALPPYDTVPI